MLTNYYFCSIFQEGEFANGFREGHGTYVFSGGCKYTGEWKDGRYNGVGSCMWTNGRCYSGEWKDGMRHGRGIETDEDGTVRHDGEWADDEPKDGEERKVAAKKRTSSASSTQQPEQRPSWRCNKADVEEPED